MRLLTIPQIKMESAAVRILALLGLAAVAACVALMVPVGHAFAKPALRRSKVVCGGETPFRRRNLAAFKKMALAPEKRLQMKKSTTKKKGCENKFSWGFIGLFRKQG